MSYQVLARKWRPRSFATIVGQEHVVRALSHALATGRLHHAWLFTGTRGVGKTTISRILAKALNCESGVTPEPCGRCAACQAIDADRFPDYVEMDAASNRGVEDMAALLDRAVYAPVQGRYKVYMIDEVHMLTGHAFNAMLKTLEEPPEHVKFILATTDPQKIPVTVLSRCLQFNLKQMPPGHIVDHLGRILEAEGVSFEPPALRHLAKAASGSMRDALSLLDQAIAHGSGRVDEEQVTHMLGTVGDDHLFAVLDALGAGDVAAMLAVADAMEARSLSFDAALQALASLLHRIALAQLAPAAIADESERARLAPYAAAFDAEFLQLAYQIAIHGRDELPLAPDEYAGFTMTLLRLHAFRPEQPPALGSAGGMPASGAGRSRPLPGSNAGSEAAPGGDSMRRASPPSPAGTGRRALAGSVGARAVQVGTAGLAGREPLPAQSVRPEPVPSMPAQAAANASGGDADRANSIPPWEDLPPEAFADAPPAAADGEPAAAAATLAKAPPEDAGGAALTDAAAQIDDALARGDWHDVVRGLGLDGLVRQFAQHCEWLGLADDVVELRLSDTHRHLLDMNPALVDRLREAISARCGRALRVEVATGAIAGQTPAQREHAEQRVRHAAALAALECDPFVRELIERFDATLVEASVRPL